MAGARRSAGPISSRDHRRHASIATTLCRADGRASSAPACPQPPPAGVDELGGLHPDMLMRRSGCPRRRCCRPPGDARPWPGDVDCSLPTTGAPARSTTAADRRASRHRPARWPAGCAGRLHADPRHDGMRAVALRRGGGLRASPGVPGVFLTNAAILRRRLGVRRAAGRQGRRRSAPRPSPSHRTVRSRDGGADGDARGIPGPLRGDDREPVPRPSILLQRAFAPLDELRPPLMQRVDPLTTSSRWSGRRRRREGLNRADADVAALADAFNTMLDRLESERRDIARGMVVAAGRRSGGRPGGGAWGSSWRELRRGVAGGDEEARSGAHRGPAAHGRGEPGDPSDRVREVLEEATVTGCAARPAPSSVGAADYAGLAWRVFLTNAGASSATVRPEALDDLGLASALMTVTMAAGFERAAPADTRRHRPRPVGSPLDRLESRRDSARRRSRDQELTGPLSRDAGGPRAAPSRRSAASSVTNVARARGGRSRDRRIPARRCHVAEVDGRSSVRVVVRDDGCGFAGPPPNDGGIRGMRERALLVRGSVEVTSAPGKGTQIVLSVPTGAR